MAIAPVPAALRQGPCVLALVLALVTLTGCDSSQTTIHTDCPALPTQWTVASFRGLGNTTAFNPFNAPTILAPGKITGNVQTLAAAGDRDITAVFAYMELDGTDPAAVRAAIYRTDPAGRPTGAPLATSGEVRLGPEPARWQKFQFPDPSVRLAPGGYFIGIWSGGPGRARLYEPGTGRADVKGFAADAAYDSSAAAPVSPNGSPSGVQYALYALYADSVQQLDPAGYTPAARAETTSVNLELDQLYMRHRVIDALQGSGIDNPSPGEGVDINDVRLVQQPDSSATPNMLILRITPWLRGAQGQHVSLQRSYRLDLKLTPYLLTSGTEPDAQKRHNLLGSDENGRPLDDGIAIRFDLVELHSLTYDQKVECSNSNFDPIDAKFLEGISNQLAAQAPFVVPTKAVTDAIAKLGAATAIDGINLGTDGDFKLGLHIKGAAGRSFQAQTALSHFPSDDWAIDIDPDLIKPAIGAIVASGATSAGLTPNGSARVEFDPGGVLRIYQSVGGCGSGNIGNVYALVTMSIVRIGPDGPPPGTQYVLRALKTPDADARVKACGLITHLANGLATATIGPGTSSPCTDVMATIAFQVSPSEWFYATALDTDGVFYIAGRSSTADAWRGSRPAVASC
jgi:hypothetical protein